MKQTNTQADSSYRRLFKEFLRQSYINGLQPLLLHTPVRYGKALWLVFLAVVVVWTHIVIYNLIQEYIVQPTEIRMTPKLVHVQNSPFPAVGVCHANKLSKRLLQEYAQKIYAHQALLSFNGTQSQQAITNVHDMARRLQILVYFFINPHDEPPLVEAEWAYTHWLLASYYKTNEYSVRDIMRHLTPDCGDLVLRGIIFGAPINTSELFLKRPTSASVCCIFNYRRPSYSQEPAQRAKDNADLAAAPSVVFQSNSILNSVQFVLQDAAEDDYVYTNLNNNAFQLYIFPQEDYATLQSNSLGDLLIDHSTIVEIPIQPKFFGSRYAVRGVAPEKRGCLYPDEGEKLLNQSYYSLDECLLLCRMASMLEHCGCVSSTMAATETKVTTCNILDLPCLMRWKSIWFGYESFPYASTDNAQEGHSFQKCAQCLPTCNGVRFDISTSVAPLRPAMSNVTGYYRGLLKGLNNKRPLAVIKLFFKQRYAQATEMDMVGNWVELLNRFGGILSLMYGFSIISYIEILYYLTGKWFVYIYRAYKRPKPVLTNNTVVLQHNYQIYWQELLPQTLKRVKQQKQ